MSTVCGVPLAHKLPETAVVLSGIAIVKTMDETGRIGFWASPTDGMTLEDAIQAVSDVYFRLVAAADGVK